MDRSLVERVKANVFPAAWLAVGDPGRFPWHTTVRNGVDADRPNSSQALGIDVFGTLKVAEGRDRVLRALATRLGVSSDGPWSIQLEWTGHENPLNESRVSQIDAAAISEQAIILFECKFTEPTGSCSQADPLTRGRHKGRPQCNGKYEIQRNPLNGVEARCALTGKGIRYWDFIPLLFDFDPTDKPCPIRGPWYQVTRNLVMAAAVRQRMGKESAVVIVYADLPDSHTARWLGSPDWTSLSGHLKPNAPPLACWSYSTLLRMIQEADPTDSTWRHLGEWVAGKCARVATKG